MAAHKTTLSEKEEQQIKAVYMADAPVNSILATK